MIHILHQKIRTCFIGGVLLAAIGCGGPQQKEAAVPEANPAPPSATEPRKAVAYVEVQIPEGIRQVFIGLGADPEISEEYRTLFLQHASSKGSGSGVAISTSSTPGTTVVVTNRHVVELTDKPRVSFDEGKTMAAAEILYVDSEYDLAVLEVPGTFAGLSLQPTSRVMQDVYAMGFPGMNHQGTFQVTRGMISNDCVTEGVVLQNGSNRCWLQHTAAIDPGSSGGPLIGDGKVMGINASLHRDRHDVFFAVPASAVQVALAKADEIRTGQGDEQWMRGDLQKTCHQFMSELGSSRTNGDRIIPLISTTLVEEDGLMAYGAAMEDPAKAVKIMPIFPQDPITGMRMAVLFFLRDFIHAGQGLQTGERCEGVNPSDNLLAKNGSVRITVSMKNGDRMELYWRWESGRWRLADFRIQ